jgi:hypothetical protein
MKSKVLLAVLGLALLVVSGVAAGLGYVMWRDRQAVAVAPPVEAPALLVDPEPAPEPEPELEAEAPAPEELASGPRFVYDYVPPRSAALAAVHAFSQDVDILRRLNEVNSLDGVLMLPAPLRLLTAECGSVNAYYVPDRGEIVLCYEMVDYLTKLGAQLGTGEDGALDNQYMVRFLLANLRFMMLHETGHALVHQLELNVTGREEDAVDQLATTLMLTLIDPAESEGEVAANLDMAGRFFLTGASEDGYGLAHYADEHSLGEQRYFNLMCMLYGANPGRYLRVVTSGRLPEARALRCPEESARITRAWSRTLVPHFAPRYQVSGERAQQIHQDALRKRRENAAAPYLQ